MLHVFLPTPPFVSSRGRRWQVQNGRLYGAPILFEIVRICLRHLRRLHILHVKTRVVNVPTAVMGERAQSSTGRCSRGAERCSSGQRWQHWRDQQRGATPRMIG